MSRDEINDGTLTVHVGKYQGKTIEEIPSDYLKYIVDKWDNEDIMEAAETELNFRDNNGTHFYE